MCVYMSASIKIKLHDDPIRNGREIADFIKPPHTNLLKIECHVEFNALFKKGLLLRPKFRYINKAHFFLLSF